MPGCWRGIAKTFSDVAEFRAAAVLIRVDPNPAMVEQRLTLLVRGSDVANSHALEQGQDWRWRNYHVGKESLARGRSVAFE